MTFKVFTLSSPYQRNEGRVGSYLVTDQPSDYKGEANWPVAATFQVTMRHDDAVQRKRAYDYAAYLNMIAVTAPTLLEIRQQLVDRLNPVPEV